MAQSVLQNNSTPETMLLLPNQICGLHTTAISLAFRSSPWKIACLRIASLLTSCQALTLTPEGGDVNGSYPDSLEAIIDYESTLATNEKMNLEGER